MKRIRTGIIGMGGMGCRYASLILSGAVPYLELAAVTRIGRNQKEWAGQELPARLPVYPSGKELIEQAEVEAVIIATPHYEHEQDVILSLRKGLHVLCEKPLGAHTLQAERMIREAEKHDLVFAAMFQQRASAMYKKLRETIQSREYGKLRRINWIVTDWYRPDAYYRSAAWRASWEKEGGGVLLNQGSHNLDLIQWLCGMPECVMAFCQEGRWHNIEVEDDAVVYLGFPGGGTGVFTASTGDLPGVNRLEIDMDRAQIVCEDGKICIRESVDGAQCSARVITVEEPEDLYVVMLKNFASAILGNETLIAPGREGINSLMMINAMYLSSWRKQIVELPLDGKEYFEELKKHF